MSQAPFESQQQQRQDRLLFILERLLQFESIEIEAVLNAAAQLIAEELSAEKVDVFLYNPAIQTLEALGTSDTPLGKRQHALGLDRIPLINGGYIVKVFQSGDSYLTGRLDQDPDHIVGMSSVEGLEIRSEMVVALDVHGERRGVLMASSRTPDFFSAQDLQFLEVVSRWIGILIHRTELSEHLRIEATQQSRRVAEELLTIVAHNLRGYLTSLHGHVDLLQMRARRQKRQEDLYDATTLKSILHRFERRIADLLDVARLDQGLLALNRHPINLASLVQETAEAFKTPETEIEVQTPQEVVIFGDAERIRQIVENLLVNAVKYTDHKTPISVRLTVEKRPPDESRAILTVSNTGPPIPADLLPRIFQPFASGTRSKGLGLGLYIAHTIAIAHHGTLTVDTSAGEKVQFTLTLPLATEYTAVTDQI